MNHIVKFTRPILRPKITIKNMQRDMFQRQPRMVYKPKPNPNPILVKPESELKALVLKDPSSVPVLLARLDEIRDSPTGWVDRMVPPPQLTFDIKRNAANRFQIKGVQMKGSRSRTEVKGIKGDIHEVKRILQWRLGRNIYSVNERIGSLWMFGWHVRKIQILFQGMGF